jgi:3-oxoacyl-[acyl-carrier-protein] synthase II
VNQPAIPRQARLLWRLVQRSLPMDRLSPVITGVGLVTPLGRTAADTWQALLDGRHIADHTRLERSGWAELSRVSALAVEAATAAVRQAGWDNGRPTAVVACTSKGPLEDWLRPPALTSDNANGGGVAPDLHRHGYGMATLSAAVADHLRLGDGPRLTLSAACAGGLQALARAVLLIRAGEADRVLCVAAEASVLPMFVASFARLGVLVPPGELCRPFDVNRQGFLMSEAAAAVCVEAGSAAGATCPLLAIDQIAFGGDASHLVAVDRDGATLRRLVAAVTAGEGVDLVHAHGTGTQTNDAAELAALGATLPNGGASATLYSHKGGLGHSLGASGLVSVALNCLAHQHGQVPPNVNTRTPMTTAMQLSSAAVSRAVRTSLASAAGFGGGVAIVRLSTP